MRKEIDGKVYDTQTGITVARQPFKPNPRNYYTETLYRTPEGDFFIRGEGGAASPYHENIVGGFIAGEDIRLLSAGQAEAWLTAHNKERALRKYFNVQPEKVVRVFR